jgi:flagellar protein FliO/FliZ
MWTIISWVAGLAILAGVVFLLVTLYRAYTTGSTPSEVLFKPRPQPRLEVVAQTNMDGRRKLVLIRRDEVEHLIMTGGPVDVVIETGIGDKRPRTGEATIAPATVFTRPARTLGQASGGGD